MALSYLRTSTGSLVNRRSLVDVVIHSKLILFIENYLDIINIEP